MTLVLRLRYKACAWKYELLLPCTESFKRDKIETICRFQMYNTNES